MVDLSAANPKHLERARLAIARTLCDCHFTDGFCNPRDRPECRCVKLADESLRAMSTVGVVPVWLFDKDQANG